MEMRRFDHSKEEKERLREKLIQLLWEYGEIEFAYLHGSFLSNLPYQDIDVAVYVRPGMTDEEQFDRILDMSAQLSAELGLPVDVQMLNTAGLEFQFSASSGQLLMARDDMKRYDYLEELWPRYFDYQYLAKQSMLDLLR